MARENADVRDIFSKIVKLTPQDKLRLAADLIDNGRMKEALKIVDMAREPLLAKMLFGGKHDK